MTAGGVNGCSEFKKLSLTIFDFCKNFKSTKKIEKLAKFGLFLFYIVQREDAHVHLEPQLKFEIEDER